MHETYVALGKANWRPIADGVERGELRATRPGAGAALLRFRKGSRVGDHVHPRIEVEFLPLGGVRHHDLSMQPEPREIVANEAVIEAYLGRGHRRRRAAP